MAEMLSTIGASLPMVVRTVGDATIDDVTHDSRGVRSGSLFVAIRGASADGHDFLDQVIDAGATAVAVDHEVDVPVPQIVVPDTRASMAWLARSVHGNPDEHLSIIGVTGTNGKTTVVHLCESVWRAAGVAYGVVGTLGARFAGRPVPLARTTPEATDLQRLLGQMVKANVRSVGMEVSSHALDLHRADAIRFRSVGFTNLTRDHLDFHGDMDTYFDSKAQLFRAERAEKAVIDIGSVAGRRMAQRSEVPVTTVAVESSADIIASNLEATASGTTFNLTHQGGTIDMHIPLVGAFNVSNAIVAAGLMLDEGQTIEHIGAGFASLDDVPGRMEPIHHDGGFSVIVDYAHTPDAISAVLGSVRESVSGRVIVVVGAGGDRDADKRELMGAAASRFADLTIVTTDNPRSEDPLAIASSVERGAKVDARGEVVLVLDRAEAIAHAIGQAVDGDMVLILGKGHEQGQDINGVIHPFDDRAVASDALTGRGL